MKSKEIRRIEAAERIEYWHSLSTSQKVAVLDSRLGVGVGAKKQRALLAAVKS
jgi:hypothetical protein